MPHLGPQASRARRWLDPRKIAEHGQYIFIYVSPKYNQVIYSLTRSLKSHKSVKQLPFLGKGTRPSSLRKDAWQPLATVSFPSGTQGLAAYKQLLEFRKRHEHEWTDEGIIEAARHLRREREMDEDEREERRELGEKYYKQETYRRLDWQRKRPHKTKGKPPMKYFPYWWRPNQLWVQNRRERAQVVMMLQKANSIADLAAVLGYQEEAANASGKKLQERRAQTVEAREKAEARIEELKRLKAQRWKEGTEQALKEFKELKNEKMQLTRALAKPDPYAALEGFYSWLNDPREPAKRGFGRVRRLQGTPVISMGGVKVEWASILDAQYANSWPNSVVHDVMPKDPRSPSKRNIPTTELREPTAITLIDAPKSAPADDPSHDLSTMQYAPPAQPKASSGELQSDDLPPHPPKSRIERILQRLKYGNN